MNIAFFTDSYAPYVSGVVRSVQRFTKGLHSLGHKVFIFAPTYYGKNNAGCDQDGYSERIFRFHSVPALTCPSFFMPIPFSFRADSVIQKIGIDIIHTHSPFLMGQLGGILARKRNIPLFFTHHTLYHEYIHYVPAPKAMTRPLTIGFLQRYCRQCSHIITPTTAIMHLVKEMYHIKNSISPIPSGVDLEQYKSADKEWLHKTLKIPSDHKIILLVGRLSKEKSPELVLATFKLLAKDDDKLHMVFVGDGPERTHLEELVKNWGLSSVVHFTGRLGEEQVINAYSGSDIFLFCSTTETQGLVTLEAMAGGLPVVAVDATGTNEIVKHGQNGFLGKSDAHELAGYVKQLLGCPELYHSCKNDALQTAEAYSLENTARMLVNLYEHHLALTPKS